jgi:type IV pilus assembly protein PilY1
MSDGLRVVQSAVASIGLVAMAASATEVSTRPLRGALLVEPNVLFLIDNSGSMDAEILLDTTEASFWWDSNSASGWNGAAATPMDQGTTGTSLTQYRKLFPQLSLSYATGTESLTGGFPQGAWPAPPTPQLAWLRSSRFNRLYYDPMVTYEKWAPVTDPVTGSALTFADAVPSQAKTFPFATGTPVATPLTVNLGATQWQENSEYKDFFFKKGMRFPGGTIQNSSGGTQGADYLPATYWHYGPMSQCTVSNLPTSNCVPSPDGTGTLKRYAITSATTTYPSGRSYADELKNFANWWQYHRKRKLMLAAAMGKVVGSLGEGLRIGAMYFNTPGAVGAYPGVIPMQSTTGVNGDTARKLTAGHFYGGAILGGAITPTKQAMKHAADKFDTDPSMIQYACQRNNLFVVTDGYPFEGNLPPVTLPGHAGTVKVSDLAKYYYDRRLRASGANALPAGKVPTGDPARPNPDLNPNLHLNTYLVTLGVKGTLWPAQDANGDNLPDSNVTWPAAPQGRAWIDDLWRASINGKGQMLVANNAEELMASTSRILFDIASVQGAQGAASFSSVNLTSDTFALLGSYASGRWSGDLTRNAIDPATGAPVTVIDPASGQPVFAPVWSAAAKLDAMAPASRILVTTNGVFDQATVGNAINPGGSLGATSVLVDYLRGDTSAEGFGSGKLRPRKSRFGAVVNSVPAMNQERSVAFVAANDGFLHAISLADGAELWAYAPRAALSEMGKSTQSNWGFKSMHDGSPLVAKIGGVEMLFGSVGAGGAGWYGIDVSQADDALDATQRASKAKWELPGANAVLQSQMGLSVARPLLVKTARWGEVLLLTSGYNAASRDGKGRLFVVNPSTGDVLATVETPATSPSNDDPGLAHVSAFREVDGTVRYVYGGDERGKLWRFDLGVEGGAPAAATLLTTLTDAAGVAQPVTTAPALVEYQGKRHVLVGTGRLLGADDLAAATHGNSFYAIRDDDTEVTSPRSRLVKQNLEIGQDGKRVILTPNPVNWATQRGWYVDLPANERANLVPQVALNAVAFVTNQPGSDPCSMNAYRYAMGIVSGGSTQPDGTTGSMISDQGAVGNNVLVTSPTAVGGGSTTLGKPQHCIRLADGTLKCYELGGSSVLKPGKAGWRRIVR